MMSETISIETACPNPECKAGIEHLLIREFIDRKTGKVLDWHQRCSKCNIHFTEKWRWIEVERNPNRG